jgi:hypothetical protein
MIFLINLQLNKNKYKIANNTIKFNVMGNTCYNVRTAVFPQSVSGSGNKIWFPKRHREHTLRILGTTEQSSALTCRRRLFPPKNKGPEYFWMKYNKQFIISDVCVSGKIVFIYYVQKRKLCLME